MNLWNYYDGDLKYSNVTMYSHEKEIAKANPKWAFDYVSKHGKDKELEPIISTSSYHSYLYAKYVLNAQPFPLGEKAIAKNATYSYHYARNVLKARFELGENVILSSKFYKTEYIAYFPDCLTNSIET